MMNRQPDKKQVRHFGFLFGVLFVFIFGIFIPWLASSVVLPKWPWFVGTFFILLTILAPMLLKPFFHLWMKFGLVMGFINTRIILFILFYLLIMPMGVLMRLLGKDPMNRKFDKQVVSYRIKSDAHEKNHMENPF